MEGIKEGKGDMTRQEPLQEHKTRQHIKIKDIET